MVTRGQTVVDRVDVPLCVWLVEGGDAGEGEFSCRGWHSGRPSADATDARWFDTDMTYNVRELQVAVLAGVTVAGLFLFSACSVSSENEENPPSNTVSVPLGGNAYLTSGAEPDEVTEEGITTWQSPESTFSVFVKLQEPATVGMSLRARVPEGGTSTVRLTAGGDEREATISSADYQTVSFGEVRIEESGYVRFDLKGLEKTGATFAHVEDLVLRIPSETSVQYVRSNEDNTFYWARRGPSVHLWYGVPDAPNMEWVYSEVTVPEGKAPIGSYFMANGFDQGYFGMQVNSEEERRILFSVWSPHETDDPSSIPDSQRVQLLAKGDNVTAGRFGGEGAGGQAYLVYPWEAGRTYRFLTRARPDGTGNTMFAAYFYAPQEGAWRLIARFERPQTDSWLEGWYSFLENFVAGNGYVERKAYYHDQWARDTEGTWHEVEQATFTGDRIANSHTREDFAGGVEGTAFYLRNGGYFDGHVPLDTNFEYPDAGRQPPSIDFDNLPR